ncbi:Zn-dependent exopeptidase [Phanerochaete sordida]|uniref:Peptide hydrolase n=1 Tax=Phanerochaete sordida TaxID=48140 RepID=A0A9P3LLC9_9APHY|nr:Zn-dependent exopeptidase [Phanerochaete sordida]
MYAKHLYQLLALSSLWTLLLFSSVLGRATSDPLALRADDVQCSLTAAWPPGQGNALVPQQPQADLVRILSQIDPVRIEAIISKLVSFGTRHTLSNQTDPVRGIGAARDWIAQEMRALAAPARKGTTVSVGTPSFIQPVASGILFPVNITNIIATIEGADEPDRVYIITGHYDSRVTNLDNFTDDAPGADDDASGVAVIMELLRIMAQMPPPRATIMLGAVAGEEQGLYGSNNFAQQMLAAGKDVQGMFTNDIVGSPKGDNGFVDPNSIRLFGKGIPSTENASVVATRESIGGENDSPARELARFTQEVASNAVTGMNVRVIYRADRFLRGGDHEPFLDAGFPAARFTEPHEDFAHQHQDVRVDSTGKQFGDLIEFCDFGFIQRVAKVNGAAIWSLAQAPGTPQGVTIDTSVLTNNSTLAWDLDPSPAVAGYEVVWRATDEPLWTSVIPVGLVSQATVQVVKDNAIMGVRAVGKNGYRSPATFPFPK